MPGLSAETLATVETRLGQDADYMKAGAPFLNAPAKEPAFDRMESTFLQAFEKWPKLILPAATAKHGPRVFELRIYEGATDQDHRRKVEMMQSGESDIFAKNGFEQIFYSETLIGPRLPSLTYMLCFDSLADARQGVGRLPRVRRLESVSRRSPSTRSSPSFPTSPTLS